MSESEVENYFLMDNVYDNDKHQRLCHLNKTRPKRSNITRPTTRNPHANIRTEPIYEELETNCANYPQENKILSKQFIADSLLKKQKPKINLEDLDSVRLRRSNDSEMRQQQINRSSTYFNNSQQSLDSNRTRNRLSMFESKSYVTGGPNHPTKYLEVFALENPKFDQAMFITKQKTPVLPGILVKQPKFKNLETNFARSKLEDDMYENGVSKTISPLPLFPLRPVVPMRFPSPVRNEKRKQTTPGLNKETVEIVVQPTVPKHQPTLQILTFSQVKLRAKKNNTDQNSASKLSKFTNRFSMFEPSYQITNEYKPIQFDNHYAVFEPSDETPKSIKDRIKMFSK